MYRGEPTAISLTGENSHTINIPLGQGSFSIGALDMNAKKFDVLVDEKLPINWDSFNSFFTPHGKSNSDRYPNGDWPRFFYYWGNDSGFSKWSQKRKIEDFTWSPLQALSADFTSSQINRLSVNVGDNKIKLKLGNHSLVSISGNVANLDIIKIGELTSISFYPTTNKDSKTPYQLPAFEAFKDISSLDVSVEPLGQAFDCEHILQFENLKSLSLSGNLTNLKCLEKLEHLGSLALRYVPNLDDLPAFKSWKNLNSFIGWNIEETKGKLLRSELKKLVKKGEMEYASVSQLRKLIWFTTEYGIPFAAWEGKNAKIAIRTYKATLKKLKKAKTEEKVKQLLIEFAQIFNDLPRIETSEREDIFEAINQLIQVPSVEIDTEQANQWFDGIRDY